MSSMWGKDGENMDRVRRFRGLGTVKWFGGGRQSKEVRLLEGRKVVAKHFDRTQSKKFEKEIGNFQMVKNCSFVPKLLAVDQQNLVLYTSYCGERPSHYTKKIKKKVRERIDKLRDKYKITRKFNSRHDGLPRLANVAIQKGKVKIVDMGPPFHPIP